MALDFKCPVCGQIFTSEMNFDMHYRNLHDLNNRAKVFENTLIADGENNLSRSDATTRIISDVKPNVLTKWRDKLARGKDRQKIKKYVKRQKNKWFTRRNKAKLK